MTPRYLVGIDLGTTNSALAYVDLKTAKGARPVLHAFPVPQLVAAGDLATRPLLPSFLYRPGPHDLPAGATALPWDKAASDIVGEFAREQGAKIPGRLVSSAKSWLCHAGVDRTAPLLPWGAPPEVPRISPLEASARFLEHLVKAWNQTMGHAEADRLEKLPVVLTVPASFDDVARTLTVEAAKRAGLTNVLLLEEPQAAFYCWQHLAGPKETGRLQSGMNCLVVDVGGGTTDFSLIAAVEQEGDLRFIREAVGDHLLLGGDNMDLALARHAETKLAGAKLDAVQFAALVQACRRAKEVLLGPDPPPSCPVTVIGRGRSVVGGTLSVNIAADDVQRVIGDGFFPTVRPGDLPQRAARAGLHEIGLPYVHDAAVTRHLAQFLERQLSSRTAPDAILFNGGVFQPLVLQRRLLDAIRPWYDEAKRPDPMLLTTPSLDLAVAFGAAAYAWIKHVGGRVIGGGVARSYYVEIDHGSPESNQVPVLCVVPRHLGENEEIALNQPELDLALGEPVVFPLYTSTARDDKPGELLQVARGQLKRLPPVQTILRAGKKASAGVKRVPVTLAARTTAIGTLELSCVARDGGTRWKLEFTTRDVVEDDDDDVPAGPTSAEVFPEDLVAPAVELIRSTYAGEGPAPKELTLELQSVLGLSRDDWPTGLCRRLWEAIQEVGEARGRSPAHLARWYNLAGFTLRPGFGHPLDRFYVDSLWKLLHAPKAGGPPPAEPVGADAWIMWRRVAGGLSTTLQKTLFDRLRPALLSGKGKGGFRPGANELVEMWRAAAALERLDGKAKEALGTSLMKQTRQSPVPPHAFWALGRLGARELLHGPLNAVVHPDVVAPWIDALLPFQAGHDSERLSWAFCLTQLARKTGVMALDVDDLRRTAVRAALKAANSPAAWVTALDEVSSRGAAERAQVFGDSLPVGLRLRT